MKFKNTNKHFKHYLCNFVSIFSTLFIVSCFGDTEELIDEEFNFEADLFAADAESFSNQDNLLKSNSIEEDFSLDDFFLDDTTIDSPSISVSDSVDRSPLNKEDNFIPSGHSKGSTTSGSAIDILSDIENKEKGVISKSNNQLEKKLEENLEINQLSIQKELVAQTNSTSQMQALIKENSDLKLRLSELEKRLGLKDPVVTKPKVVTKSVEVKPVRIIPVPKYEIPFPVDFSSVAEVNYLNGKKSMAFFTTFYISAQPIDEVIASMDDNLLETHNVSSVGELWARSIKNPYEYPDVANQIRRAVSLSSVAWGSSNIQGKANFSEVLTGDYFIIGAAPLGQIGVVWSFPITVTKQMDLVFLNEENALWSL